MGPPIRPFDTWYAATGNPAPARPALAADRTVEVAVVGAGYAGLSAALHLAQAGVETMVLEASSVGAGASGRNGGQLHPGQRQSQLQLERELGAETARRFWALAVEAVELVRGLIGTHGIACDLHGGLIHAAWKAGDVGEMQAEIDHMRAAYGHDARWIPKDAMPEWVQSTRYHGGVYEPSGGHLHALNYARGIAAAAEAAGAVIHESTRVEAIEREGEHVALRCAGDTVRARHVLLCCDTWLGDLAPAAGAPALWINAYIGVTAPLGDRAAALIPSGAAVSDTKVVVDYYRITPDGRLLFGGGESYGARDPHDLPRFLRKPILRVFPQLADVAIDYSWGGAVGLTLSRMPHMGRTDPRVLFAHGFSGHGVAIATLAGKLMADAVTGKPGDFDLYAALKHRALPGGRWLRAPLAAAAMAFYAMKDRL